MEFKLTIGHNGGIILPALCRKRLNVKKGDQIVALLDNNNLTLISLKDAVKDFQKMIKDKNLKNISLVDSLKQSRSEEKDE
jgi:bifunctional DNA-binding transcriptional regulator/antitoxin component of YhaV-PrlF toxin-antitoxin module